MTHKRQQGEGGVKAPCHMLSERCTKVPLTLPILTSVKFGSDCKVGGQSQRHCAVSFQSGTVPPTSSIPSPIRPREGENPCCCHFPFAATRGRLHSPHPHPPDPNQVMEHLCSSLPGSIHSPPIYLRGEQLRQSPGPVPMLSS